MSRTTFTRDIETAATRVGLDPDLVESLVMVESGGNPYAWNPEPRYRYLWDVRAHKPFRVLSDDELKSRIPPPDFSTLAGDKDQEWWGQSASWGLMQVMGALARERGFRGPYLTELCRWEVNLEIGTEHLRDLLKWSGGDDRVALGAYNAGKGGARSETGVRYASKILTLKQGLGPRP